MLSSVDIKGALPSGCFGIALVLSMFCSCELSTLYEANARRDRFTFMHVVRSMFACVAIGGCADMRGLCTHVHYSRIVSESARAVETVETVETEDFRAPTISYLFYYVASTCIISLVCLRQWKVMGVLKLHFYPQQRASPRPWSPGPV